MKKISKIVLIVLLFYIASFALISCNQKNNNIDSYNSYKSLNYSLNETNDKLIDINYNEYNLENSLSYDLSNTIYISNTSVSNSNTPIENKDILESIILTNSDNKTIVFDIDIYIAPIRLNSNTSIVINKDVIIKGISYEDSIKYKIQFDNTHNGCGLFWAYQAENISIYGPGTIFGNGESYTNEPEDNTALLPLEYFNIKKRVLEARKRLREAKTNNRPNVINFNDCKNIKLDHLRISEAGNWTVNLIDSDNIEIDHCVIDNNIHVANADGIDLVGCQDVTIKDTFIATADDGICIKSNSNETVKNINIYSCVVISMANNFKIGTETYKDIEDVKISHCYFYMPKNIVGGYSGIAIESADGAKIKNVEVSDIYMNGISSPLLIWLGYRHEKGAGEINNILIKDIYSENCEISSAITGYYTKSYTAYVKNVEINNFTAIYRNTLEDLNIGPFDYEQNMDGYPEITRVLHKYFLNHSSSVYYDLPTYGLFARHIDGLTIQNFNVIGRNNTQQYKDNISDESLRYDVTNVIIK